MQGKTLLVFGAHSADFVWRAAGTIAVVTSQGGTAAVIALSYGERGESGELWKELDIDVNAMGGGYMGQAEATRIAIARGLVKFTKNSSLKDTLLNYDRNMLSGDPRRKEPKKFGGPGARVRKQKSYR